MKLNDILKEAQIGKVAYETSKSTDEITAHYDADYKIFLASKRINALKEGVTEDLVALNLIESIIKYAEDIETRESKTVLPTSSYYKMKLPAISECYNALVKRFDDKKYYQKIDKQKYAKILATASYAIDHIAEEAGKDPMVKDAPIMLEDVFNSEKELIAEIV